MLSQLLKAQGPVDEIITQIDETSRLDAEIEGRIKQAKSYVTIAGIVTGICFVLIFILPHAGAALFFMSLVFFLLPLLIYKGHLTGQDLENRKIETGRELFYTLGKDMPSKTRCTMDISFQSYQKHGKLIQKSSEGFLGSVRHSSYSDQWFSASSKLHDGNVFKITIEQSIKRTEKSKRKYTKISEAIREKVKLIMRIDSTTYPLADRLPSLLAPMAEVAGLSLERINFAHSTLRIIAMSGTCRNIKGRYGAQQSGQENLVEGKKLIALFLHIYSNLQKCR